MRLRFASFIAVCGIFFLSLPNMACGQAPVDMEMALWPLPASLRDGAAVVVVTTGGNYETLRSGTNGFFCEADPPGDERLSLACHPETMRPYLERRRQLAAQVEERA